MTPAPADAWLDAIPLRYLLAIVLWLAILTAVGALAILLEAGHVALRRYRRRRGRRG